MPITMRRVLSASTATVLAAAALAIATPAQAKAGVVTAKGTCTGGAWKLKAGHDNSKIQVELELDTNHNGQSWAVRVTDNGVVVVSGTRKTLAPSGSFTVRALVADRAGKDRIVARATRAGVTCTGAVTV